LWEECLPIYKRAGPVLTPIQLKVAEFVIASAAKGIDLDV